MTFIALEECLATMKDYVEGGTSFDSVRRLVFAFFEAEEDIELTPDVDSLFQVLLPYLHYEQSCGDASRRRRIQRIVSVLECRKIPFTELAVFALEFDSVIGITAQRQGGIINDSVHRNLIAKLSPVSFDCDIVARWGVSHIGESDPVCSKLDGE